MTWACLADSVARACCADSLLGGSPQPTACTRATEMSAALCGTAEALAAQQSVTANEAQGIHPSRKQLWVCSSLAAYSASRRSPSLNRPPHQARAASMARFPASPWGQGHVSSRQAASQTRWRDESPSPCPRTIPGRFRDP